MKFCASLAFTDTDDQRAAGARFERLLPRPAGGHEVARALEASGEARRIVRAVELYQRGPHHAANNGSSLPERSRA